MHIVLRVFCCVQSMEVRVQYLLQEGSMLLPPTDTPLTGIEFTRRLPCGETERARKVCLPSVVDPRSVELAVIFAGHASVLCHSVAVPAAAETGREGASTY